MNKTFGLALSIPFFASCIALPSLTTEQSQYALYFAEAICIASIAGDGTGLNQEKVDALKAKYGSTDLRAAFETANSKFQIETENSTMQTLQDDPIKAGLFAKEVVTNIQNSCGLENSVNVTNMLKEYLPELPTL